MGILDEMAKGVLGKALGGGSSQNPLMDIVLGLITNPQTGGLQGLIQTFKEKGLGDAVSSWISTGENQPVSGDLRPPCEAGGELMLKEDIMRIKDGSSVWGRLGSCSPRAWRWEPRWRTGRDKPLARCSSG